MTQTLHKFVYYFGDGAADGDGKMKPLLGGKGANLAEMTRLGLPVPPGFTISTEICTYFYDNKKTYPEGLSDQLESALAQIEKSVGKRGWALGQILCCYPSGQGRATLCRA
jgi:pyruvate,orthophosphate dikinase